jgi:Pvc16 N-terminal domain
MSSSSVISDVTQTLEELLIDSQLPKNSFDVSLKSPADEKVTTSMKPKVNLFLFRVTENPFVKNQDWQPVTPDTLRYPPLALNLSYVLTPYAENKLDEQRVFGEAMRVLYENSIVPAAALRGGLENTAEELKVDLCHLTVEQQTQVWSALGQPYRLSACYEVRMVLIDSLTERAATRVTQPVFDISLND